MMKSGPVFMLVEKLLLLAVFAVVLSAGPVRSESHCQYVNYCDEAVEFLKAAEQFRDLKGPAALRCKTVSGEEYRAITYSLKAKANKNDELQNEGKLLKLLGFIAEDYDYAACMVSGATDSSTALYDQRSKTIVFRNDSSLPAPLVIHELTHLLQDYNFDFARFEKLETTTDARLALAALREGDAMFSGSGGSGSGGGLLSKQPAHPALSNDPSSKKPPFLSRCS